MQGVSASTSSSIPQAPSSSGRLGASNAAQQLSSQSVHQHASQQAQPPSVQANHMVAPNSVPNLAQPSSAQQALVQPAAVQPQAAPTPADEIVALRTRIAELECGEAHGVPLPARAPAPQQALVADPAAVEHIRANLAGTKEESKYLTLPALQPGHKQRELAHANHDHNLTGLNIAALALANNKIASATVQAVAPSSPSKRSAPSDFSSSPHKKSHTFASNHCFRCGANGHLPADCPADTTIAGKPVAALTTNTWTPSAPMVPTAEMFTLAASAEIHHTEPAIARPVSDPRSVVTPLNHIRLEELLCKYGIFDDWCHIINEQEAGRYSIGFSPTDPDPEDPLLSAGPSTPSFEPVSVGVAHKYLSAVRAWHIAQGWPPPLSDSHCERINWSLQGLENLQSSRRKPLRPPVTIAMLTAIKATLSLSEPFDACIWAMASCAFFGMMRFGKVSVASRAAFDPAKHLTRAHAFFGYDL
ncbi:uncharacterized protein EDB93DRAFT_1246567 [Suillus bovinus]|uniref:uncharacterized protein n=1 Tax=Suillus bovinus TaxID=48563 RepID=UPI001B8744CA|nr:uncharacterized protein EDB93DRAFT_1246567 [Suillus bovinus]KAG2158082.1 hypothetical protein EDB93DRAFT_1246567 [Suillus bovinus]